MDLDKEPVSFRDDFLFFLFQARKIDRSGFICSIRYIWTLPLNPCSPSLKGLCQGLRTFCAWHPSTITLVEPHKLSLVHRPSTRTSRGWCWRPRCSLFKFLIVAARVEPALSFASWSRKVPTRVRFIYRFLCPLELDVQATNPRGIRRRIVDY